MTLDNIWGNENVKRAIEIAEKGHLSIKFIGGGETKMFIEYCNENNMLLAFSCKPCPCGNLGDPQKECTCNLEELKKHKKEIIEEDETDLTVYTARSQKLGKLPYDLEKDSLQLLGSALIHLSLNQPQVLTVLKVAETIAGLDKSELIRPAHIAEALQYRVKE